MIIDISSYNGNINFAEMAKNENIERIIMRGTTKNGNLDTRFIENMNGICKYMQNVTVDTYKFSYARNYAGAAHECTVMIETLSQHGLLSLIDTLWLDIEPFDNREHTEDECSQIIAAYANICRQFGVKFGVYCNYSYLKNKVPKWTQNHKFWVARWNSTLGDVTPFTVELWQYTSTGKCAGIKGNVDLSKVVK